jgi:hypothetical protein
MPLMYGLTKAIGKKISREREEESLRKTEERTRRSSEAKAIMDALIGGEIEKTPAGEGTIFGPAQRQAPQGIAQQLMQALGIGQPQEERGQGYRRIPEAPGKYEPTTFKETLGLEQAKAGLKATPTKWQIQKEAYDEAFRRLGGSYMVGLDEKSKIEYENLGNQIYQQYLTQYGYTEKPETRPEPARSRTREAGDIRIQYNRLRAKGISAEEAKRQLGIR